MKKRGKNGKISRLIFYAGIEDKRRKIVAGQATNKGRDNEKIVISNEPKANEKPLELLGIKIRTDFSLHFVPLETTKDYFLLYLYITFNGLAGTN